MDKSELVDLSIKLSDAIEIDHKIITAVIYELLPENTAYRLIKVINKVKSQPLTRRKAFNIIQLQKAGFNGRIN